MSDSSSVDRWHPSNVRLETLTGTPYVMYEDYTALFADRGRVLAAARKLAEAVERGFEDQYPPGDWESRMFHAAASFREVDQ